MATDTIKNGQTCLEARGNEQRKIEIARKHYSADDPYGYTHPDAISNGDPQGKGTMHGGHTAFLPDCTKNKSEINYSNFDTFEGGGLYDIEGRNGHNGRKQAIASSLYNRDHQYGAMLVQTEEDMVRINYK